MTRRAGRARPTARLAARLGRDERGSVLPLFGLGAVAFFGAAAIAIDGGLLFVTQNHLQVTADAAAFGAAGKLPDAAAVRVTARRLARENMPPNRHGNVLKEEDVVLGFWDKDRRTFAPGAAAPNAVRVVARRAAANGNPERTLLAGVLGHDQVDVSVEAIAWYEPAVPICVMALNPTMTAAIELSGSSKLHANGCVIQVNSSASTAVRIGNASHVTSLRTLVAGGTSGSNYTPRPETGSPVIPDPLKALPAPPVGGCSHTNRTASGTITLQPGVYCGGLTIGNNAKVTLASGTYVMDNGPLSAGGTASLKGDGVFIYLRGPNGRLDLGGSPSLTLSAPTSGTHAGILIYADRGQPGLTHDLSGSSGMKLDGTMYVPAGRVAYNGSSSAAITAMIADSFSFGGSSDFQRYTDRTSVPLPSGFAGAGSATGGKARLAK